MILILFFMKQLQECIVNMFNRIKSFFQSATTRRYFRKLGKKVVEMIHNDAKVAMRNKLQTMRFDDFRHTKSEVPGENIREDDITKCWVYLNSHVINAKRNGDFSVNIGGIELMSANLYDLEQKLYNAITGKTY